MSDEFVRWEGKWGDDHERAYQLGYKAAEKVMSAIKDAALAALREENERLKAELAAYMKTSVEVTNDCIDLRSRLAAAQNSVTGLLSEKKQLEVWVNDLQSGMYVNCVYCGHRYGPKDKVPCTMADALKQHIEICPKHPMSALKARIKEMEEANSRWKNQFRMDNARLSSADDEIDKLRAELAALRGRIEALIDEGEEATKLTITSGDLSKMLREILRGEP